MKYAASILNIIKKPNPLCASSDFFHSLYSYYQISGNAFIQAVGAKDSQPKELHLLRPDRMAIIAGKGALPDAYRYNVGNQTQDFAVDKITGRSRILHIRRFNPLNDWYGLSAVEAAAYSIDQHNQSGAWNHGGWWWARRIHCALARRRWQHEALERLNDQRHASKRPAGFRHAGLLQS